MSLTESGTASGSVTANPGTLGSFSPSGSPTISFNSANPFVAPSLSFNAAYDEVQGFTNVSSFGFLGVFGQLGNWLDSLGGSEVLDADVQLASRGSRGRSDRARRVGHRGRHRAAAGRNGLPTFATAQELATELSIELGLPLSTIDADYNPATKELTYHLIVNHAFDPTNVPVGFWLDLSPLSWPHVRQ